MSAGATNQKVPFGAGGAAGGGFIGYQFGAAIADLLTSLITGLGWTLTVKNEASIETIVTAITIMVAAAFGSYFTAWLKPSGLTIEEQSADLEVAKAVDKVVKKTEAKAEKAEAKKK